MIRQPNLALAAVLLLVSSFSSGAIAQQSTPNVPAPPTTSSEERKLERVEVTGSSVATRESTTSTTVVTREEIARFGDAATAEILRRIPGVTVGIGTGRTTEVRIQGLGAGYTQILINGEPVAPGFSLDSLAPNQIERIEISRAARADQSTQAIAGSINIVLRQIARQTQREVKVAVAQYRDNPSYYLDGLFSDREGAFSYSVGAGVSRENNKFLRTLEQRGSDVSNNTTLLRRTDNQETYDDDSLSITPRFNWKLGERDSLSFDGFLRFRRSDGQAIDLRTAVFGAPPLYTANDLRLRVDSLLMRPRINWNHQFANDAKLELRLGGSLFRRQSTGKFFGFDDNDRVVLDEDTRSLAIDRSLTASGKYRAPVVETHAIVIGWDAEYSQRSEDRIQRQAAPTGYPAINLDEVYDAKVTRLALYAQDEWDITPRWSAYYGLRWEGLRTESVGNVISGVANQSNVFSPVLQTLWKLPNTKNDQVRFAMSRTYKAPDTRSLIARRFVANDNTPTTPNIEGNPDLKPELAWGLDLAYEHYFNDAGSISVSANARRIENVILRPVEYINGSWVSRPVNAGSATSRSAQLQAKLSLRKLNTALPDLDIRADIARNWSTVKSVPGPDNRLDQQTPWSGNVGFDYRPSGIWSLGANFSYRGGGPVRISGAQSAVAAIQRTLDFYGLWKVDQKTQIRLSAANLVRQDSRSRASFLDASGRFDQDTISPSFTTIRLTLERRF
jgi:outer membrane receptor for ferrienterochelin and colicins